MAQIDGPLSVQRNASALASEDAFLHQISAGFEHACVYFVKDNSAVIPGEWESGGISEFLLDSIQPSANWRDRDAILRYPVGSISLSRFLEENEV